MKTQFVGTGGAFDVDYGNSAMIVECGGKRILVDCGHTVFPALVKKGLVDTLDAVIITHLHDDHVGSLSSLILYYNLILRKGRMKLIYPSEPFRLELNSFLTHSLRQPDARVEYVPVSEYAGIIPIDTFSQHVEGMSTWAYCFREGQETVVYSGDNGEAGKLFFKLRAAGVDRGRVFHEVFFWQGLQSHTYYKDLEPYLGAFEIWGYHCDSRLKPADCKIPLVTENPDFLV